MCLQTFKLFKSFSLETYTFKRFLKVHKHFKQNKIRGDKNLDKINLILCFEI